jgi:hypothetical protein
LYNLDAKVKFLKNYWEALRILMPEAFEEPAEYVVQKTTGVFSLHEVAARVFALLYVNHNFEVEAVLEEFRWSEGYKEYFDFARWASSTGEFASYNSMGAFHKLAEEIAEDCLQPLSF